MEKEKKNYYDDIRFHYIMNSFRTNNYNWRDLNFLLTERLVKDSNYLMQLIFSFTGLI